MGACRPVVALGILFAAWGWTQEAPSRAKVTEYPVHVTSDAAALGAEYLVHSFSGKRTTYTARDHLVVEVGIFPARELMVSTGQFTLKVNGKKQVLFSQPPQFVAAAMKWDDWEYRRRMEVGAGVGDATVGIGQPRWDPRFPGDERQRRLPPQPRAPEPEHTTAGRAEPSELAEEVVVERALREGSTAYPVAGYLYFPFKGKPKSIKSLELIYSGPAGNLSLKLLP